MAIHNRQPTAPWESRTIVCPPPRTGLNRFPLLVLSLALVVVLAVLFGKSFSAAHTLFNNDGPLGACMSAAARLPDVYTGWWADLNWLGVELPIAAPDISTGLRLLLGPVLFGKFYVPFSLMILGLCAGFFFRQSKLLPVACILGGLATALNSEFFSTACWGVAMHPLTFGMNFLALAALTDTTTRQRWVKVALAGLAVGMGIMEGYDIGAIFSLYIAAYALFQALTGQGPLAKKLLRGVLRIALVAVCAAFIAVQAITSLVGTQIKGVAGMQQDEETRARRWNEATLWSMPKVEMFQLIVPGLFGYRMDAPGGAKYWGSVGQTPGWEEHHQGYARFSGGGIYAGVIVVIVALWAVLQSLRKKDSAFTDTQRAFIRFWAITAFASVLLAFGRHAPFYKFFYALPYASAIRNPAKFLHPFQWSLMILFAYGLHDLGRRYLETPIAQVKNFRAHLKNWWATAPAFDRKWTVGSVSAIGVSLLAWLVYTSARRDLEAYLGRVGFGPTEVSEIASFSFREVGWFILVLSVSVALMTLVLSKAFAGQRAKWGGILLGLWLVVDLGRTDTPWIVYYDYKDRYVANQIISLLREKPYQQRVAILPFQPPPQLGLLEPFYGREWMQHQFQYYNIQSLDIIQMSRQPEDLIAFESALAFRNTVESLSMFGRRWQLTNTRFLFGPTVVRLPWGDVDTLDFLNQRVDTLGKRFRIAERFDIVAKPGITAAARPEQWTVVVNTNGQYALFEFTGALPRAKLYANWLVSTNDGATLKQLADPSFDPAQIVLVANKLPPPQPSAITNQDVGTVEFVSYAPKQIQLRASVKAPAVLLLNDRFTPNWQVLVDGQLQPLLRCNYLMRGVTMSPGEHSVEFRFAPHLKGLYVSLAGLALGLALVGFLIISKPKFEPPPAPSAGNPAVKSPPQKPTNRSGAPRTSTAC